MGQATEGRTYALVEHDKCHWIFTKEQLPEWADRLTVIDVTDLEVQPTVGDDFDGEQFTAPLVSLEEEPIVQGRPATSVQERLDALEARLAKLEAK